MTEKIDKNIFKNGNKIDQLLLLKSYINEKGYKTFVCKCDCGKIIEKQERTFRHRIIHKKPITCGHKYNIRVGDIHGELTLIGKRIEDRISSGGNPYQQPIWRCKCSCGNEIEKCQNTLINTIRLKRNICCPDCVNINKSHQAGYRFGCLTLIEQIDERTNKFGKTQTKWLCECDCGKECVRWKHALIGGITNNSVISCGCQHPSWQNEENNVYWKGYEGLSGTKWRQIKGAAEKRNLDFEITIEEIWDKFLEQDKRCVYTGLNLTLYKKREDASKCTASLDRIDSSKGYTLDNVQWVHKKVNQIKMDLAEEEFIAFIIRAYKHIISNQSKFAYECVLEDTKSFQSLSLSQL